MFIEATDRSSGSKLLFPVANIVSISAPSSRDEAQVAMTDGTAYDVAESYTSLKGRLKKAVEA